MYFEASVLKGCIISKSHRCCLTSPGQGIRCGGKRMPCSSLSHKEVYFTFFLLWGLTGSQESQNKRGEKGKRRWLLMLEFLFWFLEVEMSLFPLWKEGSKDWLQSLGLAFTIHSVPMAQSSLSSQPCPLKPGICLLQEDSVVCQGFINPQVKYGVSFWKTSLLNDFGNRSFAFLCFAVFLSHT